ncbi:MAG: peptidoglycan-binding protein [Candidatus Paceibacterota bacterium]|jgi:hypothetical protein
MKNKILILGLAVVMFVSVAVAGFPVVAQAAGLTQQQINAVMTLLQAFGADQSVINNVQVSLSGGTPTATPPTTGTAWCYTFNTDLTVGSRGNDADALVKVLVKENIIPNPNNENILGEDFNEEVAAAVVRFQAKYGIRQTGYVGPLTRAKLNSLYGCGNQNQPFITITYPRGGETFKSNGDSVTVYWKTNIPQSATLDVIRLKNISTSQEYNLANNTQNDGAENVIIPAVPDGTYTLEIKTYTKGFNDPIIAKSQKFEIRSSTTQSSATITTSATTNPTPYIVGTASGVSQVGITISNSGGKVYGSGLVSVVNGNWSVTVSPALTLGQHTINVYDANNNLLTTGLLDIISLTNTQPSITVNLETDKSEYKVGETVVFKSNVKESDGTAFTPEEGAVVWLRQVSTSAGIDDSDIMTFNRTGGYYEMRANDHIGTRDIGNWTASVSVKQGASIVGNGVTVSYQIVATTQPSITVLSPNGGEGWQTGSTQTIRWSSSNINSAYLHIGLIGPQGTNLSQVEPHATNNGIFNWTLGTGLPVGQYKITITDPNNFSITDQSNSYFTITAPTTQPSITLKRPNGGETFVAGQTIPSVGWTAANFPAATTIDSFAFTLISSNNATYPLTLVKNSMFTAGFNGYYNYNNSGDSSVWNMDIPSNVPAGQYKLKISCASCGAGGIQDISDSYFTIQASNTNPSLSLTSPSANQNVVAGQPVTINWTSSNVLSSEKITILFSNSNNTTLGYWAPDTIGVPNTGSYT